MKHTPGPKDKCSVRVWKRWGNHGCYKKPKVFRNGKWYCTIHDPARVAKKKAAKDAQWEREWAESEKQYRLEAAAPALLEACKEAFDMVKNCPGNWQNGVRDKLDAAIKKAEGK